MLEVSALTKKYFSIDGVSGGVHEASFVLEPGAFFTLLGPSGCGKTTTLRCIAGLEWPDQGTIKIGGSAVFDGAQGILVPMNRRGIGMVFQSYAIWPHLSVFENVAFPLRVSKGIRYSKTDIASKVKLALSTVGLEQYAERSATRLSGGQQQRVALARAIVAEPRLLLLDEPLSNLDASLREGMRHELKRLQRQLGLTTVYVTHDQVEALAISDKIAVLNKGEIVQIGTPHDIYFRPLNTFVAEFVGTTNLLRGKVEADTGNDSVGSVRLQNGAPLSCLFPGGGKANAEIAVSVRPECISITSKIDGGNRFEGKVVSVNFFGATKRCEIAVLDRTFLIDVSSDVAIDIGDSVTLTATAQNCLAISA